MATGAPAVSPAIDLATCHSARDMLRAATAFLDQAGKADAAIDARRLVAYALAIDRETLLREPEFKPDAVALTRLAAFLARRAAHEPVARIVGEREFYGLSLAVGPATLDPRPDTETVVTIALHLAQRMDRGGDGPLSILDLGTGSGAIVLALLSELPDAVAVATDISPAALEIAHANADRHGLADRIRFHESHWLDRVDGRFDLIVANPPYISTAEIADLAAEVARWDPRAALDGGPDGLDAYRAILGGIGRVMAPSGWAVFEVGAGQASEVSTLATEHGLMTAPLTWPLLRDLGETIRCVVAATPGCDVKKTLGIADQSV
ncbi:MAG: peptide chain release factor N(5)-glutamine methyltransferase [Hyphomicrobiaceae bacterium]